MLAVLLTFALFAAWSTIGAAALIALRADLGDLRVALSAPILGTALTVIPFFMLSNAGVPLDPAALPVWIVLLVCSVAVLAWRRPRVSAAVIPVALLCIVELVLVGRPMFSFGFDWVANANGDAGLYILGAVDLMRHGLQSAVDFHALADNRDYPTVAQVLNLRGLRPGTQIGLAGVATLVRRPAIELYMPMSIAIAMCGVCATGALALQASRRSWVAVVAAAFFVASPLAAYGVMQQLLPQDWGLALAAALFAWLMRPELYRKPGPSALDLSVISALAAALFIVAYEVATTLALAYVLYIAILLVRRQVSPRPLALLWGVPVLVTVIVFNTFLSRALGYIRDVVLPVGTSGFKAEASLFGYAVVPTAIPGVAGIQQLFTGQETPHLAYYIVVAALLLAGVAVAAVLTALQGGAAGITLLGDVVLGILLAKTGNNFGLFKLYMYMQPFVAATVAVGLAGLKGRRTLAAAGVLSLVVIGFQVSTLGVYVNQSRHPIDLRHASGADLLPTFRRDLDAAKVPVISVTDNLDLLELEGSIVGRKPLYFLSRDIFAASWKKRVFDLPAAHGATQIAFDENEAASRLLSGTSCVVILPTGTQIALNRRSLPDGSPSLVERRCGQSSNTLAFVVSSKGQPATLPAHRRAVSFWQLEQDPSFAGQTFSGFGRYALLEVLGPTRTFRVVLEYTTSPISSADGVKGLPPASVVGATRVAFPETGSGSARVISPPLRPRMIGGRPYIVLDMGKSGGYPIVARPGLTGLFGKSASLDPRVLTSYVRDVSLISSAQYARIRPPLAIRNIPADLADPNLEYSGIYEDGWTGKTSYAQLAGGPKAVLVVRALILSGEVGQRLQVLVNGLPLAERSVKPGSVDLRFPLPSSAGWRKVELRWATATRLPAPDGRSVAAHLTFFGIVAK